MKRMTKDSVQCRFCGSSETKIVRTGIRHDASAQVRKCVCCGIVFRFPFPDPDDNDEYYAKLYRNDYGDPPVKERYRIDLDEARQRVRRLMPLLQPNTRLLELGSGSGAFLDAVRPYVHEVVGVEPDETSMEWILNGLGLKVLSEMPSPAEVDGFDLVVSFHVIEHLLDPVAVLQQIRELLLDDGTLVIEVPNVDDALISLYRVPEFEHFYYQKAHIYYFSKETISLALEKAGFDHSVHGLQRYDISNHVHWMIAREPGGQGHYQDVFSLAANQAYSDSLIMAGYSDTLWAVARKRGGVPRLNTQD